MANYLYCPRPDMNVRVLAASVGAQLIRHFDGMHLWYKKNRINLEKGDNLICWGDTLPEFDGVKVLNSLMVPMTEYDMFHVLRNVHVISSPSVRTPLDITGSGASKNNLIGRNHVHPGGDDILFGSKDPDYYMSRYIMTDEVRIHSFMGRAVRVGHRVPRDGWRAVKPGEKWVAGSGAYHPHIKCWNGGWMIKYDDFKTTASYRTLAHSVLASLGISFGVVDIAKVDNNLTVSGIGLAPDLGDRGSLEIYTKQISRWLLGEDKLKREPVRVEDGDIPF